MEGIALVIEQADKPIVEIATHPWLAADYSTARLASTVLRPAAKWARVYIYYWSFCSRVSERPSPVNASRVYKCVPCNATPHYHIETSSRAPPNCKWSAEPRARNRAACVDNGLRRAPGGRRAQEEGQRQVRLRLRYPRLHDLHPPRLRHRGDERGVAVHPERPQDLGHAGGDPHRHPQRLLPHRLLRRREDVRLDRPPPHHRPRRRHLLRGRPPHGLLRQLRHAHVRPLRRRHRRRLRAHDRARLHRRGVPFLRPRLPHLLPGGLHQLRHPSRIRLQLRLRPPLAQTRLARHARHRRGALRPARLHGPRHAGVAPLARHEGSPRGRQGRAGQDLGLARGGRRAPRRHQDRSRHPSRPRRRRGRRAQERRSLRGEACVEGAHLLPDLGHAAHPHLRDRHPLLPAGVGHRCRRALQPARVQERGHHGRQPPPRHHRGRRGHQDGLHPGGHVPPRPHRPAAAAAGQHGRHDRLPRRPRRGAHGRQQPPGREDHLGHRAVHLLHHGLRGLLLHRPRPHHVGVQLRDLPAPRARAGMLARRGPQPPHQRRHLHDLPVALQGHHHRRRLLPLRRHSLLRLGVLLHIPARDPRAYAGGHEPAVRLQGRRRGSPPRRRCCEGEEGGNGCHQLIDRPQIIARLRCEDFCCIRLG